MATQDLNSIIKEFDAVDITAISANGTTTGIIIDTAGYESVDFIFKVNDYTDGTVTPLVQEGDDSVLSDASAVADADLLPSGSGQEASAALSAAGISKIGYRGSKRYVRLNLEASAVTTGNSVSAVAVLGHPHVAPVA